MKKSFAILTLTILALNLNAQDVYSVGYYKVSNGTTAALYKNHERLYSAHISGLTSKSMRVACDSHEDVFWMVNHYNYPEGTLNRVEILKNNQVYATTEGRDEIHINDMYILNDTLYCAGYQLNEDSIAIATVWKGEDFATHWVLGDGIQASVIYDADVDKNTNIPYFCGYVSDTIQKACVWRASQLLYKYEPWESFRKSWANEISIDNGEIYTNGYREYNYLDEDYYYFPTIWKDNEPIYEIGAGDFINCLYAYQNDYYYTYNYPHGLHYAVYKNRDLVMQLPYPTNNQTAVRHICGNLDDIYLAGRLDNQGCIWKNYEVYIQPTNCYEINDMIVINHFIETNSEWYYEIQNDDGTITYQHLEYAADTTIGTQRPKIIVRSNTHYDRDTLFTETTHEYVYEENGKVYWWNKDLQEFTTLYDLAANEGDEWEIKVGTECITVHVDSVGVFGYDGETRKMLHVSDSGDFFSGDIVVGYGHLTSFFPEKLMRHNADFTVNGLRCYWVGDALLYHNGEEDCDAIYSEIHGIEEDGPSTGSETFTVYPNPTNNVLFVQTLHATSLPAQYRITNLIGQNMLTGNISDGTQLIDIESLPAGMYFISVGEQTVKFVVK